MTTTDSLGSRTAIDGAVRSLGRLLLACWIAFVTLTRSVLTFELIVKIAEIVAWPP